MYYSELISNSQKKLQKANLEVDVAFKILFAIDKNIKSLTDYTNFNNTVIPFELMTKYNVALNDYINHQKPLQYIFNNAYFYDQEYLLLDGVHSPRVETAKIIDEVKFLIPSDKHIKVLDLCCGSGIIGLTIKKHFKNSEVTLSDVAHKAVENSELNAQKYNLDVNVVNSDLFTDLNDRFDVILCNPPYIKFNDRKVAKSVLKYEPQLALYAKNKGLEFYMKILAEVKQYLEPNFLIIFEIGHKQAKKVSKLVKKHLGVKPVIKKDYNNLDRLVIVNNLHDQN